QQPLRRQRAGQEWTAEDRLRGARSFAGRAVRECEDDRRAREGAEARASCGQDLRRVHRDRSESHHRGGRLVVGSCRAGDLRARGRAQGARRVRQQQKEAATMSRHFDVKIGINPISWTNDDLPWLGGETPLEVALSEGKAIGYQGFELGNKFPRESAALKRVLAKHGLELVSGWYSGELARRSVAEEIAAVGPHLNLLADNGAKVMVYGEVADSIQGAPVPLYKRPQFSRDERWKAYADRLTAFAKHTLAHGVRLTYHHHMGAYVETPADVDKLMSRVGDEVGLLFDSGHMTFAGGDALA